jgi:hypothetical protein
MTNDLILVKDLSLDVHVKILANFESQAWEYDVNICTLVVNLYKLVVLEYYDDEQQIAIILTDVDLGVVDHLFVLAYIESCCRNT